MSDTTIPDKIAETITNIIKKGNLFSKVKKIEKMVYGCAILLTIFGTSIILNGVFNMNLIMDNNNEQENTKLLITKQTNDFQRLQYKVDRLIEINNKLMTMLFEEYTNLKNITLDEKTLVIQPNNSTISSITLDLSLSENYKDQDNNIIEMNKELSYQKPKRWIFWW